MAKRDRIHIVPDGDGGWNVKQESVRTPVANREDKGDAVDVGRGIAQREQGQLIIHRRDGTFQEERTYRDDPFPPKG